jgi:predicted transcriptional regulator
MTTDDDTPEDDDEVRNRIEQEADRAVEQFDEGLVDLLSWVLDTETRSRIYVSLRKNPGSTSDEVAEGTGLYPSTVREALAALHDEDIVTREKRESDGAGNNPYEYSAIAPSELVNTVVGDVQSKLNTVFNLDDYLDGDSGPLPDDTETDSDPVTISVEDAESDDDSDDEEDRD